MKKFVVLEKAVGETPLSSVETYRAEHPELLGMPMAYAGRLDPMASGKLLVLLGDECKQQEKYHGLDKEYEFSVLFGIGSDTHDVLGRLQTCEKKGAAVPFSVALRAAWPSLTTSRGTAAPFSLDVICRNLTGPIALPYPLFSSKTVQGKPLHTWTLEGRIGEIEIPTKKSTIYELELTKLEIKPRAVVCAEARTKIDTIPPVTDPRKVIGNDFRRVDVRRDWAEIAEGKFGPTSLPNTYNIAHFRCTASTGTYMRSLAHLISERLGTCGLAWHIHRTKIGIYDKDTHTWRTLFTS